MSAAVKYTLGRIGLFLVALAVLYPVPVLSPLVKMLVAVVVSAVLSLVLLRRWRDQFAEELAGRAERRKAEKEKLRAALAGDDQPAAEPSAAGARGEQPAAGAPAEQPAAERAR